MATLVDMRSMIKSNLTIGGSAKDDIIDGFIRAAIRTNQRKRFWFLRKLDTLTLPSSASSLALPDDFSLMDSVDLISGTSRLSHNRGFNLIAYDGLKERYFTVATLPIGRPLACAEYANSLYFSHTTDVEYSLKIAYFRKDETLPTEDSDTSVWFDDGYDAIRSLAQYLYEKEHQQNERADASIPQGYMAMLSKQHERIEQGVY